MMDSLSGLVLRATADHGEWRSVLEWLVENAGARIGVMSLRSLVTADLSFPEEAATSLSAPLIVGIAPEFVASYFDRYFELDAWTEVERNHHPHTPYFMSEHLPLDQLRETEYFKGWLEPQHVCECLVAELGLSDNHWVALNLLFDELTAERRTEIMALVENSLPTLQSGWQVSERLNHLSYVQIASASHLESTSIPCMVLNEDMLVTAINAKGLAELSSHIQILSPPVLGAPLRLRDGRHKTALEEMLASLSQTDEPQRKAVCPSARSGYDLHLNVLACGSDLIGKRRAQILVMAKGSQASADRRTSSRRIWDTEGLTPAQRAIVLWIAEGGLASEFAANRGITKKTAYDHLFAARQKLGGMSARDIYTSHQTQLASEG